MQNEKKIIVSDYDQKKIRIVDRLCAVLGVIAGIFLCTATFFMFLNICTRTFANYNFLFIYDLCGLCAAGAASFTIAYATLKSMHTTMDTILGKLPPRVGGTLQGISGILSTVILVFTIYSVGVYAVQKTLVRESTTTSGMPTWIFRWIYIFGLVVTLIAGIIESIDMFRRAKGETVYLNSDEVADAEKALLDEAQEEVTES